jgi:hypothetical protein
MPRYRHIVCIANRQLWNRFLREPPINTGDKAGTLIPSDAPIYLLTIAATHQGNYATIANYSEPELRYMDAGEQGPQAPKLGHQGDSGLPLACHP